ncbi:MAG: carboxy terminal-processing peptidase [Chryseotalea sp. WA131a]|nr:MAG: carboxy terminal-processing peptidase [Chryseotalea sp. WA131a]
MMKRLVVVIGWCVQAGILYGFNGLDTAKLVSKPVYGREANVIVQILNKNHFRKITLNDSLSATILDHYIKEMDNNKSYFLASDIKSFEKYRSTIDDLTVQENIEPAYEIYNLFRKRYKERMDYALNTLINQNFDYSSNEVYETEREKEPWAKSTEELNNLWRKVVKSQALSLKLAGKKPDEIKETLKKRYERFVKSMSQVNAEDVFSLYMNSITEAFDPHTNYLSPKSTELFKQSMSLSLEGIGARLQTDNDYTKIFEIVPGGPAAKSGLLSANDIITGVAQGKDGEMVDVIGWRIDDVVKLIKGPKGTTVRLQIFPALTGVKGPSKEISIVREKVKLEDQAAKKQVISYQQDGKEMKLGVITLPGFYRDFDEYQKGNPDYRSTTRDVRKLIGELKAEGVDGLVMDLRNNGGGALEEAVHLTGLFIKEGPVVQVKNSMNRVEVLPDDDKDIFYNGPLVVLTNRFSASASEIFAGAIQDYQRGVIVGESTYGKGTVQTVYDLKRALPANEPVGELKFTFQKFYRVTGSSTQHKGVMPDIVMPSALDAEHYGESANPSALPWDVIKSVSFQKSSSINSKVIAQLNQSFRDRMKFDANLKKYTAETEDLKKTLSQTKISLNETIRKQEMSEAEKKKSSEKLDTKVSINSDGVPSNNLKKMDDEFLREGLLILSELLTKRIG